MKWSADSGSTASSLNKKWQSVLSGITPIGQPVRVKVVDDRELSCSEEILQCSWVSQGHEFCTNFKLLQLGFFDVILGQDWLMHIDWPTKRLKISDDGVDD
jgi:hypothetical protein